MGDGVPPSILLCPSHRTCWAEEWSQSEGERERERERRRGLSLKGKEWDGGRKEGERR